MLARFLRRCRGGGRFDLDFSVPAPIIGVLNTRGLVPTGKDLDIRKRSETWISSEICSVCQGCRCAEWTHRRFMSRAAHLNN